MKRFLTLFAFMLAATLSASHSFAGESVDAPLDEDFVHASLLILEPGSVLYSRLGHTAYHMQCPTHNLDYIFSYEAENIVEKPFAFLAGKLKMGMFIIDYDKYLAILRDDHRPAREYELNLPVEVKRELWRTLDIRAKRGVNLKYDFVRRGCTCTAIEFIEEALGDEKIEYNYWPASFYGSTRREIIADFLEKDQWTRVLMHLLCGGVADDDCSFKAKVVLPPDLVDILSAATVNGEPVINSAPVTVIASDDDGSHGTLFTPVLLAVLLFVAMAVCTLKGWRAIDYVLLGLQTLLGLLVTYLVCFSTLVCTEWNWLIVPFNPLPLIFRRWRKAWALPYAVIILLWCAGMIFYPHQLTDPAYVILAFTIAVSYIVNHFTYERD